MRDILERHSSARVAVVAVAACCILSLVQAAAAHNDLDMREVFRIPAPDAAPAQVSNAPAGAVGKPLASSRAVRTTSRQVRDSSRRAGDRWKAPSRFVARRDRPLTIRMAALPPPRDGLFDPLPQKPAIVSIYDDQTLRRGDAVMMTDGLRVFSGLETGHHRPVDFVALKRAASLDWHLRKTLVDFDKNPPDHWRS